MPVDKSALENKKLPILDKSQSVLQQIAAYKRAEVNERKTYTPVEILQEKTSKTTAAVDFLNAFKNKPDNTPKLILEIKPSSPSQGLMRPNLKQELPEILEYYQQYACAISVLTDHAFFGGSIELLNQVSKNTTCPTLCKEFILDTYQLYEAKIAAASAVLLIVKMLDKNTLAELYQTACELSLTPVVEVQSETELETALSLNPSVILINHRDLDTLVLDMTTVKTLSPKIPPTIFRIAASGLADRQAFQELIPYCDAFLVGSSLMKKPLDEWEDILKRWTQEDSK